MQTYVMLASVKWLYVAVGLKRYNAKDAVRLKKYISYMVGEETDRTLDHEMKGQDNIYHSCKVYRSFFASFGLKTWGWWSGAIFLELESAP